MFSVRTVVKGQSKVLTTQWQDEEDTEIEPVMMMNVCLPALTETRKFPADPKSRLRYQPRAHSICPAPATPPPHNPLTWFFRVNSRPFKNNIINSFSTGVFTLIFIVREIGFVKRLGASFCFTILLTRRVTYLSWKQKQLQLLPRFTNEFITR